MSLRGSGSMWQPTAVLGSRTGLGLRIRGRLREPAPPRYSWLWRFLSYLQLPTAPTNPNGTLAFTMWPIGGQNVYQGDPTQSPACTPTAKSSRECNDLYVALQANLMSGPADRLVQMQNVVITNLDTGRQVTDNSITAQYLCHSDRPLQSSSCRMGWGL